MNVGRKRLGRAALVAGTALAAMAIPMTTAYAAPASPAIRSGGPLPGGSVMLTLGGAAVPKPGTFSVLDDVYCVGAARCFAVGFYEPAQGAELNEMLRWNGVKWRRSDLPNPSGTGKGAGNQLNGIRCPGRRLCWAVGFYTRGGAFLNQALRWNGRTWSEVSTPVPGGSVAGGINELFDVTCLSAASCWAVGEYGQFGEAGETLLNEILHWNGRKWSLVKIPDPGGTAPGDVNVLQGVRCSSATSCLAVGTYGTLSGTPTFLNQSLFWNGRKWSLVKTPDPAGTAAGALNQLFRMTCASPTSCWAVGNDGTSASPTHVLNQVLHWNGRMWSAVSVPQPDGTGSGASNTLFGTFCSPANCWAVGEYGSTIAGSGADHNELLHWTGSRWSLVAAPNPAGTAPHDINELFAVRCSTRRDCWAVGYQQRSGGSGQNQALAWNGAKWTVR